MARDAVYVTASDPGVKIFRLSLKSSGDFQLAELGPAPPAEIPSERVPLPGRLTEAICATDDSGRNESPEGYSPLRLI